MTLRCDEEATVLEFYEVVHAPARRRRTDHTHLLDPGSGAGWLFNPRFELVRPTPESLSLNSIAEQSPERVLQTEELTVTTSLRVRTQKKSQSQEITIMVYYFWHRLFMLLTLTETVFFVYIYTLYNCTRTFSACTSP